MTNLQNLKNQIGNIVIVNTFEGKENLRIISVEGDDSNATFTAESLKDKKQYSNLIESQIK